jgi:D-aminopeptidase
MPVRLRDLGRRPGVLPTGPLNLLTDVAGVRVGHVTRRDDGEAGVRTGVTAILPHGGDLFRDRVPAGFAVLNGFGKFAGSTQIDELGELETRVVLVNTLSVGRAVEAVVDWTLQRPGAESVMSVNAAVGETNDGRLNDIRKRGITGADVRQAIERSAEGPFALGAVGAGAGTVAFGFKGGIGSSSRVVEAGGGRWTVGVLVQSNFGGVLQIDGVPLGKRLGRHPMAPAPSDGSIVLIVATDAPLSDRNLKRLATRAFGGLARTGAGLSNGSGDYAVAFSTHPAVRRSRGSVVQTLADLPNDATSPLFLAAIEAAEEAIYDSLLTAEPAGDVEALDRPTVREWLAGG